MPQAILMIVMGLSLIASAVLHGDEIRCSFPAKLVSYLLILALLWWGGFFR